MKSADILEFFQNTLPTKVINNCLLPLLYLKMIPHFFVNAGMVPFKDVFTGQDQRNYTRATTTQRVLESVVNTMIWKKLVEHHVTIHYLK